MNAKLEVVIAGIRMKNPVIAASGTFGYGVEYAALVRPASFGAIAVKGISLEPWPGNPPPRIVETPAGLVNAIGLQNPGLSAFVARHLPALRRCRIPVIVNIWGRTPHEYAEIAGQLDSVSGVSAIEINASCPNIKHGGASLTATPRALRALVELVRPRTRLPLIAKLPPHYHIAPFARAAQDGGADAISLINTLPAMVIDVESRRPVLGNVTGGLSGPAIRPVAVKLVWDAARAVNLPIIGMGGISAAGDAIEFLLAGATAVAVGTATFVNPRAVNTIVAGIARYLKKQRIESVSRLVGALRPQRNRHDHGNAS